MAQAARNMTNLDFKITIMLRSDISLATFYSIVTQLIGKLNFTQFSIFTIYLYLIFYAR
jgi:hypothetical protein